MVLRGETNAAEAGTTTAVGGSTTEETAANEEVAATPLGFGGGGEQSGGIFEEGKSLGFLPDTGGASILILGLGALLAAGGVVIYRAVR